MTAASDLSAADPSASAGLSALAGLLADETRAAMCLALLDGRAWTAGELATHTGVARSTATEHLHRLIGGGLLAEERQGRHRYVRLADPSVANLLEDLSARLAPSATPPRGLRAASVSAAMARGRTCYDHLAGRLGVAVTDAMTDAGLLDQRGGFAITEAGLAWLTGPVGLDPAVLPAAMLPAAVLPAAVPAVRGSSKRPFARACLDWTERRPHLAGVAGARLCERFMALGWVVRIGSSRAVRVTPDGQRGLHEILGLSTID